MSLLPDPGTTLEVEPADIAAWLKLPVRPRLIDCREEEEIAICQIDGSDWVPLGEFPLRGSALADEQGVIVVCHHGMRSLRGARYLRSLGIEAFSMRGGVEAWAVEIDPSMARY